MAISDRARDFWDRISPRERKLVVLLAFATPVVIALWLGLAIHDGLVNMEARNEETRKALDIVADLRARGPVVPVDDAVATMGTDPLSLNTYLNDKAQKAGFTLNGTVPRTKVTKNHFVTDSVSLSVNDLSIDQLKKFLQEIETGSKVVVITSLSVNRNFKSKGEKLDAKLEVSTYSREPPKGEDGKPKNEKKDGSGTDDKGGSDKKSGSSTGTADKKV